MTRPRLKSCKKGAPVSDSDRKEVLQNVIVYKILQTGYVLPVRKLHGEHVEQLLT